MFEDKKVGLVLSGGGMRGIAHLGVLKAIEENNITPSIITGTSMGAIIGGLYASGNSPENIKDKIKRTSLFSFKNYEFSQPSLLSTKHLRREFTPLLKNTFEELDIPLIVNTTNILSGRHKIFYEGNLIDPIMASFAFPGVFPPVEIDGKVYVDGGVTNNFPIETIEWDCDLIIGSQVNPIRTIKPSELKNSISVLDRAFHVSMHNANILSYSKADIFIMPMRLSQLPLFSFKYIDESFELSYTYALEKISKYAENDLHN